MDTVYMQQPKVAMLIPSYKLVPSTTLITIVKSVVENSDILASICFESGIYVSTARNKLAAAAIQQYRAGLITHVWWIDDDMMLPPGALRTLLGRNKPVISGKYFGRDMNPVVYKLQPFSKAKSVPHTGVHEIECAGFGCLVMEARILDMMSEIYGQFIFQTPVETDEDGNTGFVGEDVFFFKSLQKMGITPYLDCDVECGHLGNFVTNSVVVDMVKKEGLVALEVEGG